MEAAQPILGGSSMLFLLGVIGGWIVYKRIESLTIELCRQFKDAEVVHTSLFASRMSRLELQMFQYDQVRRMENHRPKKPHNLLKRLAIARNKRMV